MSYVEGMVAAVPTANKATFVEHAEYMGALFREFGALEIVDCWGDDVPDGEVTSLPMAVQKKDDETVVFSWIIWPSKEVRNSGMQKLMEDPRAQSDTSPMPFDGKRMIFGGFELLLKQ